MSDPSKNVHCGYPGVPNISAYPRKSRAGLDLQLTCPVAKQNSFSFAIQHLAHHGRQVRHRERFLDEMHLPVKHAVVCDDVSRVSRPLQTFEVWIERQQLFGQVPAVHSRHHKIGHE